MPGTLYDYTYKAPNGYTYKGQVVSDQANTKYNYQSGQTYQAPGGGSYTISGTGTPTNAPSGAVYQQSYTDTSGKSYDSYHYDPRTNQYYDVNTQTGAPNYDAATGMYTPPGGSAVPMWSGIGLGNEYSYVKAADGSYHVYGDNTTVQLTPSTLQVYDYKLSYQDGSYYLGKVVDDGTFGYKSGYTHDVTGGGTYTIYQQDTAPPPSDAKAGYNYVQLYHDASNNTNYAPSDIMQGTPYYNKPVGYGGLGTEKDYIQKSAGYYQFGSNTPADTSTPVTTIPLPT